MAEERYQYVIIGGGLTGGWAIDGIRERDGQGSIAMLSTEADPPYDRPPLTKQLWKGDTKLDDIFIHPRDYYSQHGVTLRLETRVSVIDPREHVVRDQRGTTYRYQKLLLATGGTPRRLNIPGGDAEGIWYYRTAADYRSLRSAAQAGRSALIIGGGFIGSELAAALAMNGLRVTLLFPERYLVSRVFPEGLGTALTAAYRAKGVEIVCGDAPVGIERKGAGYEAKTRSGRTIAADLVAIGIGIAPNLELAKAAGLEGGNGIVVNDRLRTSDPDIFAAGDCAYFPEAVLGPRRIEHWDCAVSQGKHAGRNLAGADLPFTDLPFFYSDLFEFGYEAVGEVESRLETFAAWQEENKTGVIYYLGEGRVRGAMMCNVWEKVEAARALIRSQRTMSRSELQNAIQ
ncbi:MAG: NAD(P)/FAD-dependent oxidoreductase [Terriglobales bacterium]